MKVPHVVHPLPASPYFVGRRREIHELVEFWRNGKPRVLALVGLGGVGKTALALRFIDRLTQGELERPAGLIVWSFYANRDPALFLREILEYTTGRQRDLSTSDVLSELLMTLGRAGRFLVVLDGLETVQHEPSEDRLGSLEDALLDHFIRAIAGGLGQTQCLITTRIPLTLDGPGGSVGQLQLAELASVEAQKLLLQAGVKGPQAELDAVVARYGGHPLTLHVLATHLVAHFGGDVGKAPDVRDADPAPRLFRMLRALESRLSSQQLTLLSRIALFRQGVSVQILHSVIAASSDSALAGPLAGLEEWEIARIARQLEVLGVLHVSERGQCLIHPILRDYFLQRTQEAAPDVSRTLLSSLPDTPASPELADVYLEVIFELSRSRHLSRDEITRLSRRLNRERSPAIRAYSALLDAALSLNPGSPRERAEDSKRPKVFVSYVREDRDAVAKLRAALETSAIEVWQDIDRLVPGRRWKNEIRNAIKGGDFFLACFSDHYWARDRTFMNDELVIAVEELRLRPTNTAWFLPVLLSACDVPERSIGAGETLRDLQYVRLYDGWDDGVCALVKAIKSSA